MANALMTPTAHTFPIIDSHIHLFAASHLAQLSWQSPGGPLHAQFSIDEYRSAIQKAAWPNQGEFRGFVFVETDRISDVSEEQGGWEQPVEELKFLDRIVSGTPNPNEGHEPVDKHLCLAIVGWAPAPGGRVAMESYVRRVHEAVTAETMRKITGWRYLVQDKPRGTMLTENFIDALRWMGEHGYSFDLGVDMADGGAWQLDEALDMLNIINEGVNGTDLPKIVINHMGKPDMRRRLSDSGPQTQDYRDWACYMSAFAQFPNTYMKISGGLSQIDPIPSETGIAGMDDQQTHQAALAAASHVTPWLREIMNAFGPSRVMFGSDWPVCNIGGGGNSLAFRTWLSLVKSALSPMFTSPAVEFAVFGGTAATVYKIDL